MVLTYNQGYPSQSRSARNFSDNNFTSPDLSLMGKRWNRLEWFTKLYNSFAIYHLCAQWKLKIDHLLPQSCNRILQIKSFDIPLN